MAVVNTLAPAITNADAVNPQAFSGMKVASGRVKESVGVVAVANGDSIASTLRLARVHSSWRISQVLLSNTAITSAAGDVGLYDIAKAGGAVVDADFFASAVSLASAQANVDVTHEAGGTGSHMGDISKSEKAIWEVLGLTADPGKFYDVAITLTAAAAAAGTVKGLVRFIDGN